MSTTTTTTPHPVFRPGATALITGAASGIGLSIAKLCASYRMSLILLDRNLPILTAAASHTNLGLPDSSSVKHIEIDVGDTKQWEERVLPVISAGGDNLDFVVLNAGVGIKSGWEKEEGGRGGLSAWEATFTTNVFGVVNGITTLLPFLKTSSSGCGSGPEEKKKNKALVITGSKQGITNPPSNPAYNASKAAVKTLAEHLDYDLRDTNISVHLLVPGYTFTSMTGASSSSGSNSQEKPASAWYPSQVADYMHDKMALGKFYILCPDNDVTEEIDRKRILWAVGDIVEGREALSRWREERKEDFEAHMKA